MITWAPDGDGIANGAVQVGQVEHRGGIVTQLHTILPTQVHMLLARLGVRVELTLIRI